MVEKGGPDIASRLICALSFTGGANKILALPHYFIILMCIDVQWSGVVPHLRSLETCYLGRFLR